MSAGLELLRHHRVHGDHHLPLPGHEQVPFLHLVIYPILEGLSDHCDAHVDDPLLWRLRQIRVIRKVQANIWLRRDKLEDLLQ